MRLSCNGCRVLRKGCSESCSIRPCLQWIKSPDAQSNATVFLAKFYGRAGLLNLINAAAEDSLRPAVFRSLLYEACGRIVSPIYGSVGLLWSGKWHMCQAAVEAVLKGAPIVTVSSDELLLHNHGNDNNKPAAYPDIRHVVVSRSDNTNKRKESTTTCGNSTKKKKKSKPTTTKEHFYSSDGDDHQQDKNNNLDSDSDAEAASHVSQAEANHNQQQQQDDDDDEEQQQQQQGVQDKAADEDHHQLQLGLDLTLGFAPTPTAPTPTTARETHSKTPWTAAAEPQPGFLGFRFL